MTIASRLALTLVCSIACSDDAPVTGLRQQGAQIAPDVPAAEPSRPDEPAGYADAPRAPQPTPDPQPSAAAANTVTALAAEPDEPEKPARSLQRELETMLGSPASCLAPRAAGSGAIQISLSATIVPSGAVSRGEVSAAGLGPEELKCLRGRVEALRFAEPIEGAPLTVTGSLTLEQAPAPGPGR
jgi:hypothetical protein